MEIKFSEEQVLKVLIQAVRGLKGAYNEYINHLDIKPQNLFIEAHGIIKLGDFGIAQDPEIKKKFYGPQA